MSLVLLYERHFFNEISNLFWVTLGETNGSGRVAQYFFNAEFFKPLYFLIRPTYQLEFQLTGEKNQGSISSIDVIELHVQLFAITLNEK